MKKQFTILLSFLLMMGMVNLSYGAEKDYNSQKLYKQMRLNNLIDFNAFNDAIEGFNKIKDRKKDIITIIDFTKPSTEKRFYVLDLKNQNILFDSYVAHGKNSGGLVPTSFSNKVGSLKSSLGFYLTENTYFGKNGYSLRLDGLEKGINDKAMERTIVLHGANYVSEKYADSVGRLGRSWGCPAIPKTISKSVINTIKDGSVMFIYGNDKEYAMNSSFIGEDPSA
ncbi:MAG: murein L,D-transpeptidase catalytic domain family protein [Cetobacterium sp.]|uniref:murein L,D-transpeptidase catalytic domain family protein n=1 Tax=Cetobacterium sp. TaxID=2071632 RepID=UPI003F378232